MLSKIAVNYNYFLLFIILSSLASTSRAQGISQSTINSTGSSYLKNGITYEWNVGELSVIETLSSSTLSITNGLLQPSLYVEFKNAEFSVNPSNILSANSDGVNDSWVIQDIANYPDNEVIVFDRSGRVVFRTKNYQNDWKGTLNGIQLSENTYYYIIKLKKGDQVSVKKGFITIIH